MNYYELIGILNVIVTIYIWIIITRCALSFIPHDPQHDLIKIIYNITEPVLKPFRRILPQVSGIDISPIIVIIAIEVARYFINFLLQ